MIRNQEADQRSGTLRGLVDRLRTSEELILVMTSLIVGAGAGLGAVVFRYLIRGVELAGYDWLPSLNPEIGRWGIIIVPTIGGLMVGLLVFYFAREAKGHGVPEVMEAVALKGGRIRPIVALIKALASALCIGSGGSVGREGPIVQIGSALGSSIGQVFRLSDERIRNLVACGAAGGIAATFNTPIAGVLFALEIILGDFSAANFSTVVISAVTASVIGQAVFGDVRAFPIPMEYEFATFWEFALYPVLGILAALTGAAFVRLLYWMEDLFDGWTRVPEWFKPAVGGALLGSLGLGYPLLTGLTWDRMPQIFNVGYEVIESSLQGQVVMKAVVILLLLKLVATALTLGSGGSGGVFAPSLFMGSMLGAAFGVVVNNIFPFATAPPGAYALLGMGAVFAAAAHAPITAIIILFELTGDYRIILPLMMTIVLATLLARRLMSGESVYTLKLSRRGVRLQSGRDVELLGSVLVSEVMTTRLDTVPESMTIVELSELLSAGQHRRFPILDDGGKLSGFVTVADLERAIQADSPRSTTVKEIGQPRAGLTVAYPDETIGEVLKRMAPLDLGRLPVVARDDPFRLVGLVARQDVIRAYQIALTRRAELAHRVHRAGKKTAAIADFVEFPIQDGDPAAGVPVREIGPRLPTDCVLVSIDRAGTVIIPHGDSELLDGDVLTVYCKDEARPAVSRVLKREPDGTAGPTEA